MSNRSSAGTVRLVVATIVTAGALAAATGTTAVLAAAVPATAHSVVTPDNNPWPAASSSPA
jgi:hypothetical protein